MKKLSGLILPGILFMSSWVACGGRGNIDESVPEPGSGIHLVELFTSEGCSSCPPAEQTISRLMDKNSDRFIGLEYHVDYWDRMGWKDPFSKAAFTERQQDYARKFHLLSLYTPQAVVDGLEQLVGSDGVALEKAIEKKKYSKDGDLMLKPIPGKPEDRKLQIQFRVNPLPNAWMIIAMVQKRADTKVGGGENRGQHLYHRNIVRQLQKVELLEAAGEMQFKIPGKLDLRQIAFVGFVQDRTSMKILALGEWGMER